MSREENGNYLDDSLDASRFSLDDEFPTFHGTISPQRSVSAPLQQHHNDDLDINSPIIGDNAFSYEDSVVSDALAPSPLLLNSPPPMSTNISELNLSPSSYVPTSPLFSSDATRNPLGIPVGNSVRDSVSNAVRNGVRNEVRNGVRNGARSSFPHSPRKSVNNAADKLSGSDWDYLSTICTHLDSMDEEMYSTDSLRSAARYLNLPEPTAELLDVLMFLNVYRTDTWTNSLSQLSSNVELQHHEKFLAEKRELQSVLAEKLDRINTTRDFFDRFKSAFTSEILEPNAILQNYEMKKLVPKYTAVWRTRLAEVQSWDKSPEKLKRRNVYKLWSEKARALQCMDTEADKFRTNKLDVDAKATTFRLWRSHTNRASENELFARNFHDHKMWSTYYPLLVLESREKTATKHFQNHVRQSVLRQFQCKLHQVKKLEAQTPIFERRRVVDLWRNLLAYYQTELGNRSNVLAHNIQHRKRAAVFARWRREAKCVECQTRLKRAKLEHHFKLWKLNTRVLLEKRRRNVLTAQTVLQTWRESERSVESVYTKLGRLELQVSSCIASATLDEMRNALKTVVQISAQAPEVYNRFLQFKHFSHMRIRLDNVRQQNELGINFNNNLTKRKALNSVINRGTELRERRLNAAVDTATYQINHRRRSQVLRLWKSRTQRQRREYRNISQFTDQNSARSLLRHWSRSADHNRDLETEANLQRDRLLYAKVLLRVREQLTDLQNSYEAAELLDITRLGTVFKTKLRWWQSQTRQVKSMLAQADSYRNQSQRSSALEYLQGWRMQSVFSRQDVNSSVSLSRTNLYNQRTPRKRLPMSPQALQKYSSEQKRRQELGRGPRTSSSILMALDSPVPSPFQRDTPVPRRAQLDQTTSTPTKPNRF